MDWARGPGVAFGVYDGDDAALVAVLRVRGGGSGVTRAVVIHHPLTHGTPPETNPFPPGCVKKSATEFILFSFCFVLILKNLVATAVTSVLLATDFVVLNLQKSGFS